MNNKDAKYSLVWELGGICGKVGLPFQPGVDEKRSDEWSKW